MNTTPGSLLEQLRREGDQAAWERFVRLYTPLLQMWARKLGLADADAADLVQEVFTVLVEKLPAFRYDPQQRFRAWLWTILVNKVRERQRRPTLPVEPAVTEPATADPTIEFADQEYRDHLVGRALELIRSEFQPAIWQAFWLSTTTTRSAAAIASELCISVSAVYNAKYRVLQRLRQDLEGFLD
jgi:RNA polymerase sigma-70 factor (ECF subfamily)